MVPPAVVPTIWVLQGLYLFKTVYDMIFIQVAYGLAFSVLLFRSFIATIPSLIMFIFFNCQIVTDLTAGAVKG